MGNRKSKSVGSQWFSLHRGTTRESSACRIKSPSTTNISNASKKLLKSRRHCHEEPTHIFINPTSLFFAVLQKKFITINITFPLLLHFVEERRRIVSDMAEHQRLQFHCTNINVTRTRYCTRKLHDRLTNAAEFMLQL